jgi:hypothetical protein
MRKFLLAFLLMAMATVPAFAASFSAKAGFFSPSGDLKDATGSSWWAAALEYNLYKLPLATINLEVGYSAKSGHSGSSPTDVRIIPVNLNYTLKTGMTTAFGAGVGLYNVRGELGGSQQSESAIGFNVFIRQYYANIFLETKYQFADADIQSTFGSQNGVYFFLGADL